MYLIQKQKYKKYKVDDWFCLINALEQFLVNLDTTAVKLEKNHSSTVSQDYTLQYFESELQGYKQQNVTLKEMVEEQK